MVRVLFYSDAHQQELARAMRELAIGQVQAAVAEHHFHFEPVIDAIDDLAERVTDQNQPPDVLVIVGHATRTGWVATQDILTELHPEWKDGSLAFNGELLADMLEGRGLSVVLTITCFGAVIARTLTERGIVDVAAGTPSKLRVAAAEQFVRGAFRALARGASPTKAVTDARVWTKARMPKEHLEVEAFTQADARDRPLVQRPEIFIIGAPGTRETHTDFVEALNVALPDRAIFHTDADDFGSWEGDKILGALESARMIIVLFEGDRIVDGHVLNQVQAAIDATIERGGVRLFPLYLTGTKRSRRVPFGLGRLQPAFLEARGIDGDVGKLAAKLEPLLNR